MSRARILPLLASFSDLPSSVIKLPTYTYTPVHVMLLVQYVVILYFG